MTVSVLATVARFLARSAYEIPEKDLRIPLERITTAPPSGFVVSGFAVPPADRSAEDQHPA
ncbi:hypothetical protein [Streptomyces badius]|uniref:hypothetical protein n=1 Tax=Streptomyces badius TaxID=1941 RepID=UPI001F1E591D|nr:hypothetical protein [Streptomyces badius]